MTFFEPFLAVQEHACPGSSDRPLAQRFEMLRYEFVADASSLLNDPQRWNPLSGGVPFRMTQWLGPWWNTFGDDHRSALVCVTDGDGSLRGILPLYRVGGGRTLAMMGDGDACSDYMSLLARDQDRREIAMGMGRFLVDMADDPHDGWDTLDIDGAVEGDDAFRHFAQSLQTHGCRTHVESRMSVWRCVRGEDWAAHLKRHGKTQRRRMRRFLESFDKYSEAEFSVADTVDQAQRDVADIIELHQRRWQDAGEPGSYADPMFREFIQAMVAEFTRSGRSWITTMRWNGRVIAGELNLLGDDQVMYSYSTGYDVEHSDIEPGRIMCIAGLHHMYESDIIAVDFMRGDEFYKQRFCNESRRLYRLRCFAPAWRNRIRATAVRAGFGVKQWVRKRTGRDMAHVPTWS